MIYNAGVLTFQLYSSLSIIFDFLYLIPTSFSLTPFPGAQLANFEAHQFYGPLLRVIRGALGLAPQKIFGKISVKFRISRSLKTVITVLIIGKYLLCY